MCPEIHGQENSISSPQTSQTELEAKGQKREQENVLIS